MAPMNYFLSIRETDSQVVFKIAFKIKKELKNLLIYSQACI